MATISTSTWCPTQRNDWTKACYFSNHRIESELHQFHMIYLNLKSLRFCLWQWNSSRKRSLRHRQIDDLQIEVGPTVHDRHVIHGIHRVPDIHQARPEILDVMMKLFLRLHLTGQMRWKSKVRMGTGQKRVQVQHCPTEKENQPIIQPIIRNIIRAHFEHRIKTIQEIKYSINTSKPNKNLCQLLIIHFIINLIVEK